jgi:UMF1 family MFS transporter
MDTEKKTQKRNLLVWFLYDFGNSFFFLAIWAMFLAQRLIIDNNLPDIWYGASFSLATLLALVTSPILGARSDKKWVRMPFLKWSTIALMITNGAIARVALSSIPNKVFVILWLSVLVQYFYQTSLIFYNSLLKDIADESKRWRISWLGEWIWWLWRIAWLYLFLPIASWSIALIGEPGKHQIFLPAFVLSTIFMMPMLLRFKETKKEVIHRTQGIYKTTRNGIKQLWTTQKNVW